MMKREQKMLIKIIEYEVENDNFESCDYVEEACENDMISAEEEGFMKGYLEA